MKPTCPDIALTPHQATHEVARAFCAGEGAANRNLFSQDMVYGREN